MTIKKQLEKIEQRQKPQSNIIVAFQTADDPNIYTLDGKTMPIQDIQEKCKKNDTLIIVNFDRPKENRKNDMGGASE